MGQQRIGRVLHRPSALPHSLITPPLAVGTFPCPPHPQQMLPLPASVLPWHSSPAETRPPPPPPRKQELYTTPCFPPPPVVSIQRSLGRPGVSPAPTPLVPWGCLDQSRRRLTAGDSSFHADDLEVQRPAKAGRGTWAGREQRAGSGPPDTHHEAVPEGLRTPHFQSSVPGGPEAQLSTFCFVLRSWSVS